MLATTYCLNRANGAEFTVKDDQRMEFYFTLYYKNDITQLMTRLEKYMDDPNGYELVIHDYGHESRIFVNQINEQVTRIQFANYANSVYVSTPEFLVVCQDLRKHAAEAIDKLQKIQDQEKQEELIRIGEKIETIKNILHFEKDGGCVFSSLDKAIYHVSETGELTQVPTVSVEEWKEYFKAKK